MFIVAPPLEKEIVNSVTKEVWCSVVAVSQSLYSNDVLKDNPV